VLRQFRDLIQQICETPLVRGDSTARRIIYDMLHAPNPEFVDTQLDRLAELLAVKSNLICACQIAGRNDVHAVIPDFPTEGIRRCPPLTCSATNRTPPLSFLGRLAGFEEATALPPIPPSPDPVYSQFVL
jgi:hypothetical protein